MKMVMILIGMTVFCFLHPMCNYAASVPVGYETKVVTTSTEEKNTNSAEDSKIKIASEKKEENKEKQTISLFPKTGSQITNHLIVVGILLIFSLFIVRKKEKKWKN